MPAVRSRLTMREAIEKLMRLTGWNQAEVARQCHVDRATITRWLSDRKHSALGLAMIENLIERAKAGEFKVPVAQ
jgi:transcriptional regulator with XRE-family HTH domain